MTQRRKILLGVGGVAALGLFTFLAMRRGAGDAAEVRAEVVEGRSLVARVTATGHVEPKRSVEISADISGRVVRLPVEEGEDVEEGDLLLVIDPTQYEAAVRQSEAQLAEARAREARTRADYLQAEREWERLRTLKERTPDLVTEQEAEQTRTRAEVAEAEWQAAQHAVVQAEASLAEARNRLDKTVIRAPMTGRVTRLNVEQGETAIVGTMNNPGTVLLTVADLGVMETVVGVDETDVTRVSVGDSASVEIDAFPDTAFAGRVTKIGNSSMRPRTPGSSSQDQAVDFEVRITLENPPPGIRTDLSATADIVTDMRAAVPSIPIIALTLQDSADLGEGWCDRLPEGMPPAEEMEGVFVASGGTARFQPVRVGVAGDNHFEVLAGLSPGDTVVSGSYQAIRDLSDGDRLELTRVSGTPPPAADGDAGAGEPGERDAEPGGDDGDAGDVESGERGDEPGSDAGDAGDGEGGTGAG